MLSWYRISLVQPTAGVDCAIMVQNIFGLTDSRCASLELLDADVDEVQKSCLTVGHQWRQL